MNTSRTPTNGNGRRRFRRAHRWTGATLAVFVLFLTLTGIALNHSHGLGLDRKYVGWSWLLEAYGMSERKPYAGMVRLESLIVVGDGDKAHVLLGTGDLVESIDLGATLPGGIERVGQVDGRVVLQSGDFLYHSDADFTNFELWDDGTPAIVSWSAEADPESEGLEVLQTAWRGQGPTIERVLLDLHSGRIFSLAGKVLMDIIALGLVLLSLSGLVLARRRNGKL
jgi:hypothetical protein